MNSRLDSSLTEHNLIHASQVGFTKHVRTSDHCFIVKCLINKYCSTQEGRLYACFIDFHKAFDSVIHCGLKLKLLQLNVGNKFYSTINNMYSKSEACAKTGDFLTASFPIKLGIRQGINLSPIFLIFLLMIPHHIYRPVLILSSYIPNS